MQRSSDNKPGSDAPQGNALGRELDDVQGKRPGAARSGPAAAPAPRAGNALHQGPSMSQQARHHEDINAHVHSGYHAKPTKAFGGRSSAPAKHNTSGMERAMGALADRTHRPGKR